MNPKASVLSTHQPTTSTPTNSGILVETLPVEGLTVRGYIATAILAAMYGSKVTLKHAASEQCPFEVAIASLAVAQADALISALNTKEAQ